MKPNKIAALSGFIAMSVVAGLLVTLAVTPAIAVSGMAANKGIDLFENLPEYLEVGELAQPTTIYARAADGSDVALATFYSQNRLPVAFDQISSHVKDAAIASEDPRFYSHGGVDIQGTMRGALSTLAGGGVQGGSSITQQYVKNVLLQKCEAMPVKTDDQKNAYDDCVDESTGVSPDRKLREMKYAIGLEKKYTKSEILGGYLNIAGFGGTVYGIEAAARYYFNQTAGALTLAQAASLIAIVNEPTTLRIDDPKSPTNGAADGYAKNKQRRDYILQKMYEYQKVTRAQFDEAIASPVAPAITPSERGCQTAGGAAYFCDYVQRIILSDPSFGKDDDARLANFNRGGYKIYTTLDLDLQRTAETTLGLWVPPVFESVNLGGVLVGVQPGTGRVLYMAQNRQYSQDPDVLKTGMQYTSVNYSTDRSYGGSNGFQVGSTYKLFTLAQWLKEGKSLRDVVDADLRTYDQASFTDSCGGPWTGAYRPVNDEPGETGRRSVLNATAQSINTAYIAMARQMDLCAIRNAAVDFGVHTATGDPLGTNPSSVLGTNNIAPLTMATAFAGIANGGVTCTSIAIDTILDHSGQPVTPPASSCHSAVSPEIAHAMAYALKEAADRGTASGVNRTGTDMLAKTGTTDDNEQLWLGVATTAVAGAYWVGNVSGHADMRVIRPSQGTTPAQGRVPVMRAMMTAAVDKYGGEDFPAPSSATVRQTLVQVPEARGRESSSAATLLGAAGFQVVAGPPVASDLPLGTVVSTDPPAGEAVPDGTIVTIHTSDASLTLPSAAPGAGDK